MTTFRPVSNRVMVQEIAEESRTAAGIIIPDNAKRKSTTGRVIAVGPGGPNKHGVRVPMQVQVGDIIAFDYYTGMLIKVDDVEYRFLRETEIMAVLDAPNASVNLPTFDGPLPENPR